VYLWLQCKPTTQVLAKEHKLRAKKAAQSKVEQEKQAEADAASSEQDAELDTIFRGVVGPTPPPPDPAAGGGGGGGARPVRPMVQVAEKADAGLGSMSDSGSGDDSPRS
jgi:hypothetical protein